MTMRVYGESGRRNRLNEEMPRSGENVKAVPADMRFANEGRCSASSVLSYNSKGKMSDEVVRRGGASRKMMCWGEMNALR